MTVKKGVRKLKDIRERCRINDETGCWHWACAMSVSRDNQRTPHVEVPAGVIGPKKTSTTANRVAWLLSGKKIEPGQVVWRTCGHDDCCNPWHMMAGTRKEQGKWLAESGHLKGDAVRMAACRLAAAKKSVPPAVIAEIKQAANDGMSATELSRKFGLHKGTISRIRNNKHASEAKPVVAGASVFTWRPAA